MTDASNDEGRNEVETNVSLTLARANRFPLMRRFDQHFALETKFSTYGEELSRVSSKNSLALASLGHQEQRLRELQASLKASISGAQHIIHNRGKRDAGRSAIYSVASPTTGKHKILPIQNNDRANGNAHHLVNIEPNDVISKNNELQTSSRVGRSNGTKSTSVPEVPVNFHLSEIKHDSFTARWDNICGDDETIIDHEIKYDCTSIEGTPLTVHHRCSIWCLKHPVANGQFVVRNLEPNTQYRGIAIRCRNHIGWSSFCIPISGITTPPKDEDYESRRRKFIYRIGYLEDVIQNLEETRQQIPQQQVLLARNMAAAQQRILELNEEIERVVSSEDNKMLSSHLLHGATQAFRKDVLKRKLEKERNLSLGKIAQWRKDIIDMEKDGQALAAEIKLKENQILDRRAALQRFHQQHTIVSSMKHVVSKQPDDLKRYYISLWRSRATERQDIRRILTSLARSCKRRICAVAWQKLCAILPSRLDRARNGIPVDGIGGVMLNAAQICVEENLAEASDLIVLVNDDVVKEHHSHGIQCNEMATVESCPLHLLCKEDLAILTKGDFLFSAGHFESSLKCFQCILSKMESKEYFSGMSPPDAAALYSEVNGKTGHAKVQLGMFDHGLVYFGRQLSLSEEEDLQVPKICALLGLGICYHEKCDHVYAEDFFQRALGLCLARDDKARELIAYTYLRKCCECLNRPAEARRYATMIQEMDNTSWERETGGTAVSRKLVNEGLGELDSMRLRLIDVIANKSEVIELEVVSTHRVQLQNEKNKKEQQLSDAIEQLAKTKHFSEELQELEEQIAYEIDEAKNTKKNRLMSALLAGSNQNIKTAELLFRLQEEQKVVRAKLDQSLTEISQAKMFIHNTKDDIKVLNEELVTEGGPLMRRVLKRRKYRCISLNASNTVCDDVAGRSKNGVEYVALSEGHLIHVHNLNSGKLEDVFICDGEGGTVSVPQKNSTIASLFFYGNRIYAGTMDSNVICWDVSTSQKVFVAKGHESTVTCIYADDTKLVSGSADKSIILWTADGTMIRRVSGHARGVHCIQCGPSWCVSASYGTVFVWDIIKEKENDKIKEFNWQCRLVLPTGNVTVLQYGELEVITGDSLGALSVWWIESGEVLRTFKAHEAPVASLQVDATKAVSSGLDMVIVLSDIIQGVVLHTLRGHLAPVLAVAFDRNKILSVSSNGELRYWPWENPPSHRSNINKYKMLSEQEEE